MKSERSFRKQAGAGRGSRIIAAAALAVMITIAAVFTVSAYDPAADPIVTVSYLNEVFRSSIHSELLNEMGFESYEDLKEALSKAVVDEDEIVSAAKAAVLKSFGYSSWSSAKSAFTATTITQADRQKIADEAIAQLMESLNIASTDELREKLETVEDIAAQTKQSFVEDLGYSSIEELKAALQGATAAVTVTLYRGDVITALGDCDIIVLDGLVVLGSGTVIDVSRRISVPEGEPLESCSNNVVCSDAKLISVSSECTVMIRGPYRAD